MQATASPVCTPLAPLLGGACAARPAGKPAITCPLPARTFHLSTPSVSQVLLRVPPAPPVPHAATALADAPPRRVAGVDPVRHGDAALRHACARQPIRPQRRRRGPGWAGMRGWQAGSHQAPPPRSFLPPTTPKHPNTAAGRRCPQSSRLSATAAAFLSARATCALRSAAPATAWSWAATAASTCLFLSRLPPSARWSRSWAWRCLQVGGCPGSGWAWLTGRNPLACCRRRRGPSTLNGAHRRGA